MVQLRMIYGCENVSSTDSIFNTNFHETLKQKKELHSSRKQHNKFIYNVSFFID